MSKITIQPRTLYIYIYERKNQCLYKLICLNSLNWKINTKASCQNNALGSNNPAYI